MNEAVQQILDPIHHITAVYRQLVEISLEKREAIQANRTDIIMQLTSRENRLMKEIAAQNALRDDAVNRFATELGLFGAKSITMEQLVQSIPIVSLKQLLLNASEDLASVIVQLHDLNEQNLQAIRLHLEYINYSIDLITGPSEDEATYHRSLQEQGFVRMSQFDRKA